MAWLSRIGLYAGKNYTGVIPRQESGAAIGAMGHAAFQTIEEAKIFFRKHGGGCFT